MAAQKQDRSKKKAVKVPKTAKPTIRKKRTPKKKNPAKPFPFLELPSELRNQIYRYCLVDRENKITLVTRKRRGRMVAKRRLLNQLDGNQLEPYHRNEITQTRAFQALSTTKKWNKWDYNYRITPQLLECNRQIHDEAASIFYAENVFRFHNGAAPMYFLTQIGNNRQYLRSFAIPVEPTHFELKTLALFHMLLDATNLNQLALGDDFLSRIGRDSLYLSRTYCMKRTAANFHCLAHEWLKAVGAKEGRIDAGVDMLTFASHGHHRNRHARCGPADDLAIFRTELKRLLS